MKLGNHGWGMRDMIIYTCILILFLLIAAYSVKSLYDVIDNPSENNNVNEPVVPPVVEEPEEDKPVPVDYAYYNKLELDMKNATMSYLSAYPTTIENEILKVTSDSLTNLGYMGQLYDQTKTNKCLGYSNVFQDSDGDYIIKSYISCNNYVTEGY